MSISFSTIPPDLKIPLFYAEFDNSQAGANQPNQRALILGQAIGAGGGTPAPVWIASPADAASEFGAASQLAAEVAAYPRQRSGNRAMDHALRGRGGIGGGVGLSDVRRHGDRAWRHPVARRRRAGGRGGCGRRHARRRRRRRSWQRCKARRACRSIRSAARRRSRSRRATMARSGNSIPISLAYYGARGGEVMPPGLTCTITPMSGGAGDPDLSGLAAAIARDGVRFHRVAVDGSGANWPRPRP